MNALQRYLKESQGYNLSRLDELTHNAICALITIAERQQKEIESLKGELAKVKGENTDGQTTP